MTELHLDADEWANISSALHEMIERQTDENYKGYLEGIRDKVEIFLDPIGYAIPLTMKVDP